MNDKIEIFIKNGYLISPKFINEIKDDNELLNLLKNLDKKPLVIDKDIIELSNRKIPLNWEEFDKLKVLYEKNKDNLMYESFFKNLDIKKEQKEETNLDKISENEIIEEENNLIILKNYGVKGKKHTVQDFVGYYKLRYNKLKNILVNRPELSNATSINRLLNKTEKERVAVIGMVYDKRETKNGNTMLTLEDPTGLINVIVNKSRNELYELSKDLLLDQVVGITGLCSDRIIFVDNIFYPDIPGNIPLKKSNKDEYAIFTSDFQVGNKLFYEKNFLKFIDWLNLKYGDQKQKEIAKKVKYLFIPGDIVEGVGVYPQDCYVKLFYQGLV